MTDSIISKQIDVYKDNFVKNKFNSKGLFWNDKVTQFERFNQLIKPLLEFKRENFSICDVGSGVADMHHFLSLQGLKHEYFGVEIVPEMVEVSLSRFKDIEIINIDILNTAINRKFDFVVLSGVFNLPGEVEREKWKNFIFSMIEKMFEMCDIGISFNGLTTYSTFTNPDLYYLNPLEVVDFIQNRLSRYLLLNSSYPLFENTFTVFKENAIKSSFQKEEFSKYY